MLTVVLAVALCAVILASVGLWLDVHHTALTRDRIKAAQRRNEAWLNLYHSLNIRAPLPVTTDYAISPELLALVVNLVVEHRPKRVLELGSGLSTAITAYALERYSSPEHTLVSVDHEAEYAGKTTQLLRVHGLEAHASVRHGALRPITTPFGERQWYDRSVFDLTDIDLLIVDGPPGKQQSMARYPALPELLPRLAKNAIIVVDDSNRPDETAMVEAWAKLFDCRIEKWFVEKGATLLYRNA